MCQCRRCMIDKYNKHMAEGGYPYLPRSDYRCGLCNQLTCERANDHRLMCIQVRLANGRRARYWNGKEMNYDE